MLWYCKDFVTKILISNLACAVLQNFNVDFISIL